MRVGGLEERRGEERRGKRTDPKTVNFIYYKNNVIVMITIVIGSRF